MSSLDVTAALDVAKHSVSKILTSMETHGHVVASGGDEGHGVLLVSRTARRSFVIRGAQGTAVWRLQFCGESG